MPLHCRFRSGNDISHLLHRLRHILVSDCQNTVPHHQNRFHSQRKYQGPLPFLY